MSPGACAAEAEASSPLEDCLEIAGRGGFQTRLLLLCAVGYFATCSEMLVAVVIERQVMEAFGLSSGGFAVLPFAVNLASFLTTFGLGRVADAVGRRLPFVLAMALVAACGAASAFATSWPALLLARAGVGVGNGCLAVVDYVVFVECTPASRRGARSMTIFLGGCLGVLYVAGLALAPLGELPGRPEPWRALLLLAALPMVATLGLRMLVASETPRYLAAQRRYDEAFNVLERMSAGGGAGGARLPSRCEFVRGMLAAEAAGAEGGPAAGDVGVAKALGGVGWHTSALLVLLWLLQATSYWGFTLFLPVFLTECGVRADLTIFFMVLAELPGGVAAALLMDRCGRVLTLRAFLFLASAFALVTTVASAAPGRAAQDLLALGSVGVYAFLIPVWSVLFVLTPELYPTRFRARALGVFQTVQGIPGCAAPFLSAAVASQRPAWRYMALWSALLFANGFVSLFLKPARHRVDVPVNLALAESGI